MRNGLRADREEKWNQPRERTNPPVALTSTAHESARYVMAASHRTAYL